MPPRRVGNRRVNNKKTGKAKKASPGAKTKPSLGSPDMANLLKQESGSSNGSNTISAYQVYKRATADFKAGLQDLVPPKILAPNQVQNLIEAVQYIRDNAIGVPISLMRHLLTALRIRKLVSSYYAAYSKQSHPGKAVRGCDDGHAYFIEALTYCRDALYPLLVVPKREDEKNEDGNSETEQVSKNRFDALQDNEEDIDAVDVEVDEVEDYDLLRDKVEDAKVAAPPTPPVAILQAQVACFSHIDWTHQQSVLALFYGRADGVDCSVQLGDSACGQDGERVYVCQSQHW
jgi:hypothetical protein